MSVTHTRETNPILNSVSPVLYPIGCFLHVQLATCQHLLHTLISLGICPCVHGHLCPLALIDVELLVQKQA